MKSSKTLAYVEAKKVEQQGLSSLKDSLDPQFYQDKNAQDPHRNQFTIHQGEHQKLRKTLLLCSIPLMFLLGSLLLYTLNRSSDESARPPQSLQSEMLERTSTSLQEKPKDIRPASSKAEVKIKNDPSVSSSSPIQSVELESSNDRPKDVETKSQTVKSKVLERRKTRVESRRKRRLLKRSKNVIQRRKNRRSARVKPRRSTPKKVLKRATPPQFVGVKNQRAERSISGLQKGKSSESKLDESSVQVKPKEKTAIIDQVDNIIVEQETSPTSRLKSKSPPKLKSKIKTMTSSEVDKPKSPVPRPPIGF